MPSDLEAPSPLRLQHRLSKGNSINRAIESPPGRWHQQRLFTENESPTTSSRIQLPEIFGKRHQSYQENYSGHTVREEKVKVAKK
jgi:hypothetical protein